MTPEVVASILAMRHKGVPIYRIARVLRLEQSDIKEAIAATRIIQSDKFLELVDDFFEVHVERLEMLWDKVQKRIDELVDFDVDVFRSAIQILERQAKLLGLDKGSRPQIVPTNNALNRGSLFKRAEDWLEQATPSELLAEVKSYGIAVPKSIEEHFESPVG